MLQLENDTPFAAERTIVMDKDGEKSWVVVVKATYLVQEDGTVELAAHQLPPLYSPEYSREPGRSSMLYEADLIATKATTDILINGQAYAPAGKPAESVDVGFRIGALTKRLRVWGDRLWYTGYTGGLRASSPLAFERMPITYERAFGGWDKSDPDPSRQRLYSSNPVGAGFAMSAGQLNGHLLPNVEYPGQLISSWRDRPSPAGFGAIASYWSPRLECGGTYDDEWMENKFPLLPDDFDDRFYQSAPTDQQTVGYLRGGEIAVLVNLTQSGRWQFRLPKVYLAFSTWFGSEVVEHRASLQTVIIEPDARRVIMVWQTSLDCHHELDDLDTTVIREKLYF
ncbi:DUF2169 domain-containing protein [Caballeronia sp. J97]|uniref:DUF2169 family type VI secretion system accessory protein n=1 Tax=Caballeronia sp. J97 TaxID=2805429 RepID=UPI002AB2EEBB|nr:DUF2169 domain-containing protein [Caballeronia sp. J97]